LNKNLVVRCALWLSVPFNLYGAFLLAFPSSALGQAAGLPPDVPVSYRAVLAFFPLLFACAYAWLGSQPVPDRPLVAFSAAGKAGVFAIVGVLWCSSAVPVASVAAASGDLLGALVFAWWLLASRSRN